MAHYAVAYVSLHCWQGRSDYTIHFIGRRAPSWPFDRATESAGSRGAKQQEIKQL